MGHPGEQVWSSNELVSGLVRFMVSKEAKMVAQQFTELQRKWTQVVKDLKEVDSLKCLDNHIVIQSVMRKLPDKECRIQYCQRILLLN